MLKILLIFFIAISILAISYCSQQNDRISDLNQVLDKQQKVYAQVESNLKNEIEYLKTALSHLEAAKFQLKNSSSVVAADVKTSSVSVPGTNKLSKPEWTAKLTLRKVEEHIALTPSERSDLEEKFRNGENLSALSDVVGEERAKKYFDEQENAQKVDEEDAIKEELFKLSRVLNLNSEQESQVSKVLKNSRDVLKESYVALRQQEERAMELHSEPSSGDELRAVYENYRVNLEKINSQENQILSEQLKGVLTEDQLNKLLEYQTTQKVVLK